MILHVRKERVDRLDLDKIADDMFLVERTHWESCVCFCERFENFVGSDQIFFLLV